MITPRLYVGAEPRRRCPVSTTRLPEAAARHVAPRAADARRRSVALFTGDGGEYAATIRSIDRATSPARRVATIPSSAKPVACHARAGDHRRRHDGPGRSQGGRARRSGHLPLQCARSQNTSAERMARRVAHWRRDCDRRLRAVRPQPRAGRRAGRVVRAMDRSGWRRVAPVAILDADADARSRASARATRRARSRRAGRRFRRRGSAARAREWVRRPFTSAHACCARKPRRSRRWRPSTRLPATPR